MPKGLRLDWAGCPAIQPEISIIYAPGFPVDDIVWVRGIRLREAREAARLKLIDVSQNIMSPANLSRIERHDRYRLPLTALVALGRRLGLVLEDTTRPHTWACAVANNAIERIKQWRFSEAVRVLHLRDTVLSPVELLTEVRAQILEEWARAHCGYAERPHVIHQLGLQAQKIGALREAVWTEVFKAEMHDHAGNRERALAILPHAARDADRIGETVDILCTRAAWARILLKDGRLTRALEALQEVATIAESTLGYGQARFLHACGLLHIESGQLEAAEQILRRAVMAASGIPNYRLAGAAERALANVYELRRDTERADAALIRAASLFTQAGDSHDAAEMISSALRHHIFPSWPIELHIARDDTKDKRDAKA